MISSQIWKKILSSLFSPRQSYVLKKVELLFKFSQLLSQELYLYILAFSSIT